MLVTNRTVRKWNVLPNLSLTTRIRLHPPLFVRETKTNVVDCNIPTVRQINGNSNQNITKEIQKVTIVISKLPHNPFKVLSNDSVKKVVSMYA